MFKMKRQMDLSEGMELGNFHVLFLSIGQESPSSCIKLNIKKKYIQCHSGKINEEVKFKEIKKKYQSHIKTWLPVFVGFCIAPQTP